MVTKYELIKNAGEDRDKIEIMIDAMEKHKKIMRKAKVFMFIGISCFIFSFIVLTLKIEILFIPSIISSIMGFFSILTAVAYPLKKMGLI